MSDLNVALLRLDNQMKAGAADAKRDLQKLKAEAERLGKVRASVAPDAVRSAQQSRQMEMQRALAVERTTAAIRRQRNEMLATDMAARRLDRAREVRSAREVQRAQRESRALQTAAAAAVAGRGIDWGARGGLSPSDARRRRSQMMATTLAAQRQERAAEARALREARAAASSGRPSAASPAATPSRGPAVPGGVVAGTAGGMAAAGRAAGLSYGKALVGGLGIGIGVAAVGEFVKESILGAADDEFERDQLRVLGNISDAQMKEYRKNLDRMARLRGIGSKGALGIFGGLMAGGLDPKEAAAFSDNVAVFSKATQASVDDASAATVALRNNMRIRNAKELMAAYDAINVGGKAGEFEVADMARHLPSGLAGMANLGEQGISGVRNTVAMLQAIRRGTGTSAEAMTQFEAMLNEFTSPTFIRNAGKLGINVEKTMKDAHDNGLSPVFAVLNEIEKKTRGDKFKLGKLIPNTTSAAAIRSILRDIPFVLELLKEMERAGGSTMKDYKTATDNAREAWNRFSASIIERSKEIAEKSLPQLTSAMDAVTEALDNTEQRRGGLFDYIDQLGELLNPARLAVKANQAGKAVTGADGETIKQLLFGKTYDERKADAYREYARSRMAARRSLVPAIPLREGEDASMKAYQALRNSGDLEAILEEARAERERLREARRQANRNLIYKPIDIPGQVAPGRADDGTLMPTPKPGSTFQRMLDGMRNPAGEAAEEAMNEFNEALGRGLDDARAQISTAVAEFRQMLSFSAGPTISPAIVPASATISAPAQSGGGTANANVQVTQHFTNSDPRLAMRRAQREQNRSMNLALANALHDTRLA